MRGIRRLSASRGGSSPADVIKQAVALTIDEGSSRFYQIATFLKYCGYNSRFGFRIEGPIGLPADRNPSEDKSELHDFQDYLLGVEFLERSDSKKTIWIDQADTALGFSQARQFSSVIRNEALFRRRKIIQKIQVYLERQDGVVIELMHASSGELALISALIFLIISTGKDPIILIDEPENSLHPAWQREYVENTLVALDYRNATIVIATHAPLIVTGALAKPSAPVSVFQVRDGQPVQLKMPEVNLSSSVEEILWKAFDVITPANHFVSEEIVDAVSKLEKGELGKREVLSLVDEMNSKSFDDKQQQFFGAVKQLVENFDTPKDGGDKANA
jgi:hypothetical protein